MKFPKLILTLIFGLAAVWACEKTPEDQNSPTPEEEKNERCFARSSYICGT